MALDSLLNYIHSNCIGPLHTITVRYNFINIYVSNVHKFYRILVSKMSNSEWFTSAKNNIIYGTFLIERYCCNLKKIILKLQVRELWKARERWSYLKVIICF